jgi:predicted TIM-barrel fold metal-dependent hydrolase
MDSSGSNSWMKYMPYDLDLKQIFRKAVQAGGSSKILFGTDSTFFPRGWRFNVLEAQVQTCRELEAEGVLKAGDLGRIFHDNVLELTGLKPASTL